MTKSKYISGQISNLTEDEYHHNFEEATLMVQSLGFSAINPLEVQACETEDCVIDGPFKSDGSFLHSWDCYLKYDIIEMLKECDTIVLLPNWKHSKGARLELHVAEHCGLSVWAISTDYKRIRDFKTMKIIGD